MKKLLFILFLMASVGGCMAPDDQSLTERDAQSTPNGLGAETVKIDYPPSPFEFQRRAERL